MKKSYIYFLVPILGLVAFAGIYWQFSSTYEKRVAEKAAAVRLARDEKLKKDAQDREKAVLEAKAAQDKRKIEKAAKEAKAAKDLEDRNAANQAYRKAMNDADKAEGQAARLKSEVAETNKEIQKIEEDKRRSTAEIAFLKDFVKQADANRAQLMGVLEKIEAADKAAAANAAAAAAAAAKK